MRLKFFLFISFLAWGVAHAQEDDLKKNRYITRSTMIGAGYANIFDTYLSPLEYTGPEVRFVFENMRMTHLMDGNVSAQHVLQANCSYTKNPSKSVDTYSGMISWSYALHYQKKYSNKFKVLFGPIFDLNGGFIYNRRNSNNPAQAKVYTSLGASAMAIYKFHVKRCPMTVRYQANLPLLGAMFSPDYGESYYEMFGLGHGGIKNVVVTSLHNRPSLQQMLTLDMGIGNSTLRLGYICDLQQAKVKKLKYHAYSHNFMIGVVKHLYLMKGKNKIDTAGKLPF